VEEIKAAIGLLRDAAARCVKRHSAADVLGDNWVLGIEADGSLLLWDDYGGEYPTHVADLVAPETSWDELVSACLIAELRPTLTLGVVEVRTSIGTTRYFRYEGRAAPAIQAALRWVRSKARTNDSPQRRPG